MLKFCFSKIAAVSLWDISVRILNTYNEDKYINNLANIPFVVNGSYNKQLRKISYIPSADPINYDLLVNYYNASLTALMAA